MLNFTKIENGKPAAPFNLVASLASALFKGVAPAPPPPHPLALYPDLGPTVPPLLPWPAVAVPPTETGETVTVAVALFADGQTPLVTTAW